MNKTAKKNKNVNKIQLFKAITTIITGIFLLKAAFKTVNK